MIKKNKIEECNRECIICGNARADKLYNDIVKCHKCGHIFAKDTIDENEQSALYGKDYFFGNEYIDYIADKQVIQKNFKLRLQVLKSLLSSSNRRSLLEIGCAYGFFLEAAQKVFALVTGIDISEEAINYARDEFSLNAACGDFLSFDFSGVKFDTICMWDTIEHLRAPQEFIKKIAKLTDKGALLAVTTGDVGSVNARLSKDRWRLIHTPTHLHYFSRKTLAKMLDGYGFDVVYNRYCGFYRSADFALYRTLGLNKKTKWVYDLLNKTWISQLYFYSNLYDIVYIIARKR